MDAAGHVFARRGYHAANLDEVADEAGLSKGAVYYNFGSKQELFLALISDRIGERLGEIARVLARLETDPHLAGDAFMRRIERDPRWAPLFFEFVAIAARTPAIRDRFADWTRRTRAELAQLIETRFDALGVESRLAPAELAAIATALANGLLIERMFDRSGVRRDLLGDAFAALAAGVMQPNDARW